MRIHKIEIYNFKSIYGNLKIDFDELEGMIKLSGPIGAGKTSLGEAILWLLYGSVQGQNNPNLCAWECNNFGGEIWLESAGKNIWIKRSLREQTECAVDGVALAASSKNDMQQEIERLYDVPKMAIERMCIISFNQFNSLAKMNPGQTKQFLDEVFGFKTFSEYNEEVLLERKDVSKENARLQAVYDDTIKQITSLRTKRDKQKNEIVESIDIEAIKKRKQELIEEGIKLKEQLTKIESQYKINRDSIESKKTKYTQDKATALVLGKSSKTKYEQFKNGVCPTCGHAIESNVITDLQNEIVKYREDYKINDTKEKECNNKLVSLRESYNTQKNDINKQMTNLRNKIYECTSEVDKYNLKIQTVTENLDNLINDAVAKAALIEKDIQKTSVDIGEWNDMSDLFSKTLRYSLLDKMIPHINTSIQSYLNKLEQPYTVKYDEEFKAHIFTDGHDIEIPYTSLSTGQKKSLDICIIFGILKNVIANVNFNLLFCDELMSNMDSDSRTIMLEMLKENLAEGKTIFVINHAEMSDDMFTHKIRVSLKNKKIKRETAKKSDIEKEVVVKASQYELVF